MHNRSREHFPTIRKERRVSYRVKANRIKTLEEVIWILGEMMLRHEAVGEEAITEAEEKFFLERIG